MISCLTQNIHEERIVALLHSSSCEKCCHIKIMEFRSEGTPWYWLIQSPAQSRANFQGSTRLCPAEF